MRKDVGQSDLSTGILDFSQENEGLRHKVSPTSSNCWGRNELLRMYPSEMLLCGLVKPFVTIRSSLGQGSWSLARKQGD